MNLTKLFDMQKVLDERIEKEHPRQEGEDRLAKKILALQVELGELANEWRGFKFWKVNQEPVTYQRGQKWVEGKCETFYRNPLLEEYVDCLHFILSIGLEIDFNIVEEMPFIENDIGTRKYNDLTTQFIWLGNTTSRIYNHGKRYYDLLLTEFLALGEMLDFTWEQIEQAYISKNEVNHDRQNNNY